MTSTSSASTPRAFGFMRRLPEIWRAEPMGDTHTYERVTRRAVLDARGGVVRLRVRRRRPRAARARSRSRSVRSCRSSCEHKPGFRPA